MSHNLTIANGRAEMAYVGETPWHGLGQELKLGASIEEWQRAAGMNWRVQRSKVRYFADKNGQQQMEWPEQHVLFRSDSKAPLGVVSDGFKIVQPAHVLEFFRDLTVSNRMTLETAGTLKGGAIYWALAKTHDDAEVSEGDSIKGYVLLSTAADGTRKTVGKFTSVRVVCNNTLSAADREHGGFEHAISHRSIFDANACKADLGLAHDSFARFMASARALSARKMSRADMARFTLTLLGGADAVNAKPEAQEEILASKPAQGIATLYAGAGRGAKLDSARDTAWGAVNAVTEYVDYYANARSDANRLTSAWFGQGARLKSSAMELALAMV